MHNKVRFGIIGYGKVAALHAKALETTEHAELVSVSGHRQERRDAFAHQWGLNSRNSVEEMIKEDGIQAVVIARHSHGQLKESLLPLGSLESTLTRSQCRKEG